MQWQYQAAVAKRIHSNTNITERAATFQGGEQWVGLNVILAHLSAKGWEVFSTLVTDASIRDGSYGVAIPSEITIFARMSA